MNKMLEKLKEYGADIDGAMGRFLDDVDLYKTCFDIVLSDEAFSKLGKAIETNDYKNAFEYAHTLKGTIGNMGLTILYKIICHIVEDLRKNEYSNLQNYYAQVIDELRKLQTIQCELTENH